MCLRYKFIITVHCHCDSLALWELPFTPAQSVLTLAADCHFCFCGWSIRVYYSSAASGSRLSSSSIDCIVQYHRRDTNNFNSKINKSRLKRCMLPLIHSCNFTVGTFSHVVAIAFDVCWISSSILIDGLMPPNNPIHIKYWLLNLL